MRQKALIVILLFFVLSQAGCGSHDVSSRTAILMGTLVEIQIVPQKGAKRAAVDSIIDGALCEIRKIEKIFSFHNPDSELSLVNKAAIEKPRQASNDFMYLLVKSKEFYELTDGAFDVSVAPFIDMWQRAYELGRIPTRDERNEILQFIGTDKLKIDENAGTIQLKEGMKLDFGAIAKGYAVERAMSFLKGAGIRGAIVKAGGDMYCLGDGRNRLGWRIGIKHPRNENELITTLIIKDRAIATSGDYERYKIIEGRKFSHIVNPKTGMTVEDIPMSVTILADDCVTADAVATAVFVLGPERGMELIEKLDTVEGVIVSKTSEGLTTETSKGLKELEPYE